jgi:hypothetical protein
VNKPSPDCVAGAAWSCGMWPLVHPCTTHIGFPLHLLQNSRNARNSGIFHFEKKSQIGDHALPQRGFGLSTSSRASEGGNNQQHEMQAAVRGQTESDARAQKRTNTNPQAPRRRSQKPQLRKQRQQERPGVCTVPLACVTAG